MKRSLLNIMLLATTPILSVAHAAAPSPTPHVVSSTPTPNTTTTPATQASTAAVPDHVDCTYILPNQTTPINPELIKKWAAQAAEQAFTLNYTQLDSQLKQLRACFTSQGWKSFQDALTRSGNITAIKTQSLTISAMTHGTQSINEIKPNEWKVSLPLQVIYQNKEQKLVQELNVDCLIGRKLTGDLGIMQLIAIPKPTNPPVTNPTTEPTAIHSTPSTPAQPATPSAKPGTNSAS